MVKRSFPLEVFSSYASQKEVQLDKQVAHLDLRVGEGWMLIWNGGL